MSVRRKLFAAIAALILAMGVIFVFLTLVIVRNIILVTIDVDRSKEIGALSAQFADFYRYNGNSWEGVGQLDLGSDWRQYADAKVLLMSTDKKRLYPLEDGQDGLIRGLGIRGNVRADGKTIAFLYYYDQEVGNIAKLKYGISSSVTVLLLAGSLVIVLVSLFVAYRLAKRMTSPLQHLIPAIDRLGKGELGVQVPIQSKDEYGTVAQAFNAMSTQIQRTEDVRRSLVADVAHELRTPITIIRGKLDLIQQSGHAVEPESLLPLQDELIRLTRLVEDLHLLSLAEAKKLPIERKHVPIPALLRRMIDHISPNAESKGIEIKLLCRHEAMTAYIDPNRMTQVFLNLLVNAVRYTPSGGTVIISAEEEAAHNGNGIVRVAIADTGIGIDPEHLPYVFNRFFRTEEARTRNNGGMGLGLAIAKELVAIHGGTIEVESSPGRGTTFIVKLPVSGE